MVGMDRAWLGRARGYLGQHWRKVSLLGLAGLAALLVVVQLFAPWPSAPLGTVVNGVAIGGLPASEAVKKLDESYAKQPLKLHFGKTDKPYREPLPADIGLTVKSQPQVDAAVYSWWLRLVPTSIWWAQAVVADESPQYERDAGKREAYVAKELGESCKVEPVNASVTYKDNRLQVVPAIDGGTCDLADVEKALASAAPTNSNSNIRIAVKEQPAKLRNDDAQKVVDKLNERTKDGMSLRVGEQVQNVPRTDVLSWLDFAAPDSGVVATVNAERSKKYFDEQVAKKVAVAPGVSQVTTRDFTEISRSDGPNGQALDTDATLASINKWLSGDGEPTVATRVVPPTVNYTRSYSPTDTGLSALIAQFDQANPGTFGVSFAELDGQKRRATHQDTKTFRTASTYKLFVAYGTLKRIESGAWKWSDQVHGGRNLTKCFDDMIVKSDNPCAETLLAKIGYKTMTNELKAIGLTKSSFMNSFPETTAADLTTFVGALQSGQLLSQSSRSTLLSAMERNVYRKGIPAGANGKTADKVGFLDAFLHDAAIVYSPSGTYALTILTEGSSWGKIAELTREIEKLRNQ